MKKIFTNQSKCYSAIVAIIALVNSFLASASEYKPIIRYDRVWENKSLYYTDEGLIRCMRFDGSEEINGKTYHRVVTFKKSHWENEEVQAYVTEDCYELEGYMREEDGVVYALVYEDCDKFGNPRLGGTWFPTQEEGSEPLSYKEYVLYDMNLNEGDHYTAFTDLTENGATLDTFNVLHTSFVDVAGEKCKIMYVCDSIEEEYDDDVPYDWYHPIVEGIGIVESGCLNYLSIEGHKNTGMWYHKCFERFFDIDGNVLYYGPNYDDRLDALNYGSFVSEVNEVKDTEMSEAPLYDILGRRIANPAPGQLYIQGGKKRIAK